MIFTRALLLSHSLSLHLTILAGDPIGRHTHTHAHKNVRAFVPLVTEIADIDARARGFVKKVICV